MEIAALPSLPAAPAPILPPAQHARAAHLRGEALRHASEAEQRAAVATQFEAILVRQLLGKTLTSMVGSGRDAAANVYGDLLTDTLAQQLTAGGGLGLAPMIERQLSPRATRAAAAVPTTKPPIT